MHFKNIMVAYDGSDLSYKAIDMANDMVCHHLADKVTVLSVVDPFVGVTMQPEFDTWGTDVFSAEIVEENLQAKKTEVEEAIADCVDDFAILLKVGTPQKVITHIAKKEGCDLIIMGNRGLGSIRSAFGSVSLGVLREATVPVLIVK